MPSASHSLSSIVDSVGPSMRHKVRWLMTLSLPDTRDEPMTHPVGIGFVLWIGAEQVLFGADARDLDDRPDQQHHAVDNGWMGQHKSPERQQIGRVDRVARRAIQS